MAQGGGGCWGPLPRFLTVFGQSLVYFDPKVCVFGHLSIHPACKGHKENEKEEPVSAIHNSASSLGPITGHPPGPDPDRLPPTPPATPPRGGSRAKQHGTPPGRCMHPGLSFTSSIDVTSGSQRGTLKECKISPRVVTKRSTSPKGRPAAPCRGGCRRCLVPAIIEISGGRFGTGSFAPCLHRRSSSPGGASCGLQKGQIPLGPEQGMKVWVGVARQQRVLMGPTWGFTRDDRPLRGRTSSWCQPDP